MEKEWECYLDMDGILTDFIGSLLSLDMNEEQIKNIYKNWPKGIYDFDEVLPMKFEKILDATNIYFWIEMKKTEEFNEIIKTIFEFFKHENIFILTTPYNSVSAFGKYEWLHKNMPNCIHHKQFILTHRKEKCAAPNRILIDDNDLNVENFIKNGGKAILFPRKWNSGDESINPIEILKKELKIIFEQNQI